MHDWYNVVFPTDFTFKALANGASVGANTESAPINASFSLIKRMTVQSAGRTVYEADKIHKIVFIKNLLDYSGNYARSVAKDQFWQRRSNRNSRPGIRLCRLVNS